METELCEVRRELAARFGHPEIGRAGQSEPTADRGALHRGDHWRAYVEQLRGPPVQPL